MTSVSLSRRRKEVVRLSRERSGLEGQLLSVLSRKKLVAASIVEKYKKCNKGGCRCTRGEPHGPFLYLSFKEGKKTKMVFIPQRFWEPVSKAAGYYRRWRQARARIVKIDREILILLDRIEKVVTVSTKELMGKRR